MTLEQARANVGRRVFYKPGGDVFIEGVRFDATEVGVITSVNDSYVFVRYEGDRGSKATYADTLTLAAAERAVMS